MPSGTERSEPSSAGANAIRVSGINIEWHPDSGTCTFEKLPVAMMWVDTTLAGLFSGVQAMVGTQRYLLALQSEGRKSVEADWRVMSQFADFRDGFKAIANIAAVAGWGEWSLESIDMEKKECRFRICNSWEGRYQKALGVTWGSGMLAGKMAGYCSKLFGENCWADQTSSIAAGDSCDEFVVRPSTRSVEKEIDGLLATDEATRADMAVALRKLEQEIGEHKRLVEAIRVSEERYRALVETTGTGYVIVDPAGRVLDANQEYVRLSGHGDLRDILGRNVVEWTAPADRERNDAAVAACAATGHIRNLETQYIDKEGRLTPVEINATIVGSRGSRRILSLCRDITARKQSEEMLRNAQKLESLGVLAGGIAHDFNNLLTGIFGYLDLARSGLPRDSEVRENIEMAISVFTRAKALTQQLLTFSKGGLPAKRVVSIPGILHETVRFALSGSNISPSLDVQENLWACNADAHQIGQVLDNIVINARQAMPLGGVIAVSARNVAETEPALPPLPQGRFVRIAVRDHGIGIPREIMPRIFDPFFTTKQQGSGLGLATAYSIVKKHDGHIFVESEPGKGATFTVYLPALREDSAPEAAAAATPVRDLGAAILLMDDEEFILKVGSGFLGEMGCSVTVASNGREAVGLYRAAVERGARYDLVILDLTIPGGMGGTQALAELLKIDPSVAAIASSGYSDDPAMADPQRYGFKGKLNKPYLKEDFQTAVGRFLASIRR